MGALQPMPEGAAERLALLLHQARSKAEYQRIQCVWLRAKLQLSSTQIAQALGWQASSVRHVQARYLQNGEPALRDQPRQGGRRALLTAEQEQALLAPFIEQSKQGELVVATPIRQCYEATLGHPVHASTVYRALHRQGWRKVQPRPQHPKTDAKQQEAFKKSYRN